MRVFGFLYFFGLLLVSESKSVEQAKNIHAVLIAGSNTWENYRHQADVLHAYHVLLDHGVKQENLITMIYDDIANSDENPFPGKIFNAPKSADLYKNVKIDYKGDDVHTSNVMAVLKGDTEHVKGGNGRVLKSTENDRVFVYFVDHGAPGVLSVVDDYMSSQQLNDTLQTMYDKKMFGKLVFYLEACESGSMFEGILPSNLNILAITASNATEPSWGTYCDDPILETCLGDLFSTSWLEDADIEDLTTESLKEQFNIVKKNTILSNVMRYGDQSLFAEAVGNFLGRSKTKRSKGRQIKKQNPIRWPSKDIPLLLLEARLKRTTDPVKSKELTKQIEEMKKKRDYHDAHTRSLIQKILPDKSEFVRQTVLMQKPTRIHDMRCHHKALDAYHNNCFNFGRNPYALNVAGPLNNLCALEIPINKIVNVIEEHCAHKKSQMINIR